MDEFFQIGQQCRYTFSRWWHEHRVAGAGATELARATRAIEQQAMRLAQQPHADRQAFGRTLRMAPYSSQSTEGTRPDTPDNRASANSACQLESVKGR
jgi:hypothetical protein